MKTSVSRHIKANKVFFTFAHLTALLVLTEIYMDRTSVVSKTLIFLLSYIEIHSFVVLAILST
jgi:hypothetical protein